MKSIPPSELNHITQETLRHYHQVAAHFWEGTKDHDVTQNYHAFLHALPQREGLNILDFGCGPGRDLVYFKGLGHVAVGLDGCPDFCRMARENSGCDVWEMNFLELKLPVEFFDGIFANASLFHVPSQELKRILQELRNALKPQGILFSSNPRGEGEGWSGGRYGTFMEIESYQKYLEAAGFKVLHHYYRPAGKPRAEQPWLAVVSQK